MAQVPISALPAGAPINGTEEVPMVQGGVTVRVPSAVLVGPAGPRGPVGPTGPAGPIYARPFTAVNAAMSPYTIQLTDTVILADASAGPVVLFLSPSSTWSGPPLTVKRVDLNVAATVTVVLGGFDVFDPPTSFTTLTIGAGVNSSPAYTLVADGGTAWFLLGGCPAS